MTSVGMARNMEDEVVDIEFCDDDADPPVHIDDIVIVARSKVPPTQAQEVRSSTTEAMISKAPHLKRRRKALTRGYIAKRAPPEFPFVKDTIRRAFTCVDNIPRYASAKEWHFVLGTALLSPLKLCVRCALNASMQPDRVEYALRLLETITMEYIREFRTDTQDCYVRPFLVAEFERGAPPHLDPALRSPPQLDATIDDSEDETLPPSRPEWTQEIFDVDADESSTEGEEVEGARHAMETMATSPSQEAFQRDEIGVLGVSTASAVRNSAMDANMPDVVDDANTSNTSLNESGEQAAAALAEAAQMEADLYRATHPPRQKMRAVRHRPREPSHLAGYGDEEQAFVGLYYAWASVLSKLTFDKQRILWVRRIQDINNRSGECFHELTQPIMMLLCFGALPPSKAAGDTRRPSRLGLSPEAQRNPIWLKIMRRAAVEQFWSLPSVPNYAWLFDPRHSRIPDNMLPQNKLRKKIFRSLTNTKREGAKRINAHTLLQFLDWENRTLGGSNASDIAICQENVSRQAYLIALDVLTEADDYIERMEGPKLAHMVLNMLQEQKNLRPANNGAQRRYPPSLPGTAAAPALAQAPPAPGSADEARMLLTQQALARIQSTNPVGPPVDALLHGEIFDPPSIDTEALSLLASPELIPEDPLPDSVSYAPIPAVRAAPAPMPSANFNHFYSIFDRVVFKQQQEQEQQDKPAAPRPAPIKSPQMESLASMHAGMVALIRTQDAINERFDAVESAVKLHQETMRVNQAAPPSAGAPAPAAAPIVPVAKATATATNMDVVAHLSAQIRATQRQIPLAPPKHMLPPKPAATGRTSQPRAAAPQQQQAAPRQRMPKRPRQRTPLQSSGAPQQQKLPGQTLPSTVAGPAATTPAVTSPAGAPVTAKSPSANPAAAGSHTLPPGMVPSPAQPKLKISQKRGTMAGVSLSPPASQVPFNRPSILNVSKYRSASTLPAQEATRRPTGLPSTPPGVALATGPLSPPVPARAVIPRVSLDTPRTPPPVDATTTANWLEAFAAESPVRTTKPASTGPSPRTTVTEATPMDVSGSPAPVLTEVVAPVGTTPAVSDVVMSEAADVDQTVPASPATPLVEGAVGVEDPSARGALSSGQLAAPVAADGDSPAPMEGVERAGGRPPVLHTEEHHVESTSVPTTSVVNTPTVPPTTTGAASHDATPALLSTPETRSDTRLPARTSSSVGRPENSGRATNVHLFNFQDVAPLPVAATAATAAVAAGDTEVLQGHLNASQVDSTAPANRQLPGEILPSSAHPMSVEQVEELDLDASGAESTGAPV